MMRVNKHGLSEIYSFLIDNHRCASEENINLMVLQDVFKVEKSYASESGKKIHFRARIVIAKYDSVTKRREVLTINPAHLTEQEVHYFRDRIPYVAYEY